MRNQEKNQKKKMSLQPMSKRWAGFVNNFIHARFFKPRGNICDVHMANHQYLINDQAHYEWQKNVSRRTRMAFYNIDYDTHTEREELVERIVRGKVTLDQNMMTGWGAYKYDQNGNRIEWGKLTILCEAVQECNNIDFHRRIPQDTMRPMPLYQTDLTTTIVYPKIAVDTIVTNIRKNNSVDESEITEGDEYPLIEDTWSMRLLAL